MQITHVFSESVKSDVVARDCIRQVSGKAVRSLPAATMTGYEYLTVFE